MFEQQGALMGRLVRFTWICALGVTLACGDDGASSGEPTLGAGSGATGSAGTSAALAGSGGSTAAGAGRSGSAAAGGAGARAPVQLDADAGSEPVDRDAGQDPAADPRDAASEPDDSGPSVPAPACEDCCSDGFPRGAAVSGARKLALLTPSPEGVTVCPDGSVFVARDGSGEVWRVPLNGAPAELWAKLGDRRPAGISCDELGRLFVAIFSTLSGDAGSLGPVLITGRDAAPIELPQPGTGPAISGLNGIVAVPQIGVYTSDSSNNRLLLTQETAAGSFSTRVVASDVPLANGLAFDPKARALYAVASGAGQLLKLRVGSDGELSERSRVGVSGAVLFMDGVAIDENGVAYVADWLGGSVVRVTTGATVARVTNPASLAFRGGTLLITDYKLNAPQSEGGLYAVDLAVCGAHTGP